MKALEKLKRQLADADAELEARKNPPEDVGPKIIGEGLVIDEWVSFFFFFSHIYVFFTCMTCITQMTVDLYFPERAKRTIPCSATGWRCRLGLNR